MSANVYGGKKGPILCRRTFFHPLTISQHTKLLINHVVRHARLPPRLFQLSLFVAQIKLGFRPPLLNGISIDLSS